MLQQRARGHYRCSVILLDNWLQPGDQRRWYPVPFYAGCSRDRRYLVVWGLVGRDAVADVAPPFLGTGAGSRLAVALPAVLRAARLLVWPLDLSVDYSPQGHPSGRRGFSGGRGRGAGGWERALSRPLVSPPRVSVSFAAAVAALAYLPTSNLLFPSGVVLAERNLYLPVLLVAAAAGLGAAW